MYIRVRVDENTIKLVKPSKIKNNENGKRNNNAARAVMGNNISINRQRVFSNSLYSWCAVQRNRNGN